MIVCRRELPRKQDFAAIGGAHRFEEVLRWIDVVQLGRKNYLFVGHPRAGRNLAGLYSLVGSCIANRVEPTEYLTDVLPKIPGAKTDDELDALLPDRWTPPLLTADAADAVDAVDDP